MLLILIFLVNLLIATFLFYNFYHKRINLPPGPTPLPLVGNLLTLMNNQPGDRQFLKWSREYGPIYTYWVGELPVVCITDFNKIIETFQKDGETYAGRYSPTEMYKLLKGGTTGVVFTEGGGKSNIWVENRFVYCKCSELWRDQRRFTLHVFRDFGLGKNLMQEKVDPKKFREDVNASTRSATRQEGTPPRTTIRRILEILLEVGALIAKIDAENEKGKTEHNVHSHIDMAVGSIINKLLFGYRYSEDKEEEFYHLKGVLGEMMKKSGHPLSQLILWNPKLFKDLPVFKPQFNESVRVHDQLYQFYEKIIREHEADLDLDEPPTDYVAAFLKEKAKQDKLGESHYYTISQLKSMCFDLWLAGQETTSTTLAWGVAYLIHNPEALEQLYEELDRVIQGDRQITLADRPNLPFTNAVVNETQRVCNLLPQNIFHKTTKDVTIYGYLIKKGTCILPQISAVLCNDDIFKNAEKFNPNRFLDVNGQLKKCDELIPFGVGKRQCLGEALARMELFLILANIFNTFKVSACETPPSLTRSYGGTVQCPPYLCKMQRRHT